MRSTLLSSKTPRKAFILFILLFGVLLVAVQGAVVFLASRSSSLLVWLIGTPVCYLLVSVLCALAMPRSGEKSASARNGTLSGLFTGLCSTLMATIILAGYGVYGIYRPDPQIPSRMAPTLPPSWALLLIFLIPFVAVNLIGVGFATLGGLVGGLLQTRHAR